MSYYLASTFVPPGDDLESLSHLTFELRWSSAKRKMVDEWLIFLPKHKGGWDVVHLMSKAQSLFFFKELVTLYFRCV